MAAARIHTGVLSQKPTEDGQFRVAGAPESSVVGVLRGRLCWKFFTLLPTCTQVGSMTSNFFTLATELNQFHHGEQRKRWREVDRVNWEIKSG